MTLAITLPIPDRGLSPNARKHFMAKAKLVKNARTAAMVEVLSIVPGGWKPRWRFATVRIQWFTHTKRRPDADNCLSSLKPAMDGIADSGLLDNDRGLRFEPIEFAVDRENPRIVIHISNP